MQLGLYRTTSATARWFNEFGVLRLGKMMNRGARSMAGGNAANSHIKISDKERGQPQFMDSSTYEEEFPPISAIKGHVKSKRRTRIDLVTCSNQKPDVAQNIGPLQCEPSNLGIPCSGQKLVVQNVGSLQREASKQTCSKQKLEEFHNISPLQCEASTSMSDLYDTDLPAGFWKKPLSSSRSPKPRQTYREHQEATRRSKPSSSAPIDEPFDIRPPETADLPTSFGKKPSSSSRTPKLRQTYHEHHEAKRRSMPSSCTQVDGPFDICLPETTKSTTPGRGMWARKRQLAEENVQNKGITLQGLVLGPGMVLLKNYIPLLEQVNIVNKCRELGCGPGGFYRPGYNDGAKLRLHMMCLGLDWDPQTASYGERRRHDNAAPPGLPNDFSSLVSRALDDSHNIIERNMMVDNVEDVLPKMSPDLCIVNFYTSNGRLGLHQDRDETQESLGKGLPVVSISIGDSAEFLYGNQRDVNKAESVTLESGDVLVFGGESRHVYHGVKAIIPDTTPPALLERTRLRPGRLNLTFRKY